MPTPNPNTTFCTRCVLPGNYPGITFDADGVCSFCRAHRKQTYSGEQALRERIASVPRGRGSYDCVVPISGGKDSTFVLYYVTQVLKLKALAVNYDNGFTHPMAQENLRRIVDKVGAELIVVKGIEQRRRFAGNLRAYLARPSVAMVPMMCTGCRIGIVGSACKAARERGVSLIIMGWSPIEDTPFKGEFLARDGGSTIGGLAKNVIANPRYLLYGGPATQVIDYLHTYSRVREWGRILRLLHPGITQIAFYDYIEYNPERIQQTVAKEVGWSSPDPENSWQFDCQIKSVQNYLYRNSVGFTALNDYLSAKIREGYITREQALETLHAQGLNSRSEYGRVCNLLREMGQDELIRRLDAVKS